MSSHPLLIKMLKFIEDYQRQQPNKSSSEIVRELRAYTRSRYVGRFWELVAGESPDFVRGELDSEQVSLAGEEIDFAHFIAVLSDQFPGGNLASTIVDSFFWLQSLVFDGVPYDSREFTSAIGDTGQAIDTYLARYGDTSFQAERLESLLNLQASPMDYASDLTGFMVGRILQQDQSIYVSDAIRQVDKMDYTIIVHQYLQTTLGGKINQGNSTLDNLNQIKVRINKRINTYLFYTQDLRRRRIFNSRYRQKVKPALVALAAEHFLAYLLLQGNLRD